VDHSYKPQGYSSVSPYLIVEGAVRLIDLLKGIFDARELRRFDNPDGSVMHAEVQIDDSVIMLADASSNYPANQLLLHVYVPDAVATFKKAIALGCPVDQEPQQKEGDPDVRGSFLDFAGNVWAVGTQKTGQ
jgi:PhnB protein